MSKMLPLDEAIGATLTVPGPSSHAAVVLERATAALKKLAGGADQADLASLNPLATGAEAAAHRREASDLRFDADRMEASVAALTARVTELRDAERRAEEDAAERRLSETRDALAADIARDYPRIVRELTTLVKRVQDSDAAMTAAFGLSFVSAEAIGRGLPRNFGGAVRLIDQPIPMPSTQASAWQPDNLGTAWVWHGLTIPETTEPTHD